MIAFKGYILHTGIHACSKLLKKKILKIEFKNRRQTFILFCFRMTRPSPTEGSRACMMISRESPLTGIMLRKMNEKWGFTSKGLYRD